MVAIGASVQSLWTSLLQNTHPAVATVAPCFVGQLVPFWTFSAIFLFIDYFRLPAAFYKRYKLQPEPFPRELIPKVIRNVAENSFYLTAPTMLFAYLCSVGRFSIRLDAEIPSFTRLIAEVLGCVLMLEVTFYYCHLAFHSRLLYKYHKVHHELTAPIGISAFYMHAFEFIGMALSGSIAAMAVNAHAISAMVYFGLGAGGGVLNHSGFRMPWTPQWLNDPDYHDFHHEYFDSNISFLGIMDWLHGTNRLWLERHSRLAKYSNGAVAPSEDPSPPVSAPESQSVPTTNSDINETAVPKPVCSPSDSAASGEASGCESSEIKAGSSAISPTNSEGQGHQNGLLDPHAAEVRQEKAVGL